MALPLLAQHIKSFTASPHVRSTDPECFTFTNNGKQTTFLCTPDDASHALVQEVLSFEEPWFIITYDKKLLRVVGTAIAEGRADVMMMFEMKLVDGRGLNPHLDEELRVAEIEIVEDKDWFIKAYPEQANMVEVEQTWVARSRTGSEVMGYVQVLSTPSDIYIGQVRVLPDYRSKGIAKKLLNFIHGRERNKPIQLHTFAENLPAIGLYHSLGYRLDKVAWQISKAKAVEAPAPPAPAEDVAAPDVTAAVLPVAS